MLNSCAFSHWERGRIACLQGCIRTGSQHCCGFVSRPFVAWCWPWMVFQSKVAVLSMSEAEAAEIPHAQCGEEIVGIPGTPQHVRRRHRRRRGTRYFDPSGDTRSNMGEMKNCCAAVPSTYRQPEGTEDDFCFPSTHIVYCLGPGQWLVAHSVFPKWLDITPKNLKIFLLKHSLAHYSTYSNVHPPAHTTPHNTTQHHTTHHHIPQQHTLCTRRTPHSAQCSSDTLSQSDNTMTFSRTRPTSFKVAHGLQRYTKTICLMRTCHRTGNWPRPMHSGGCVALPLRCGLLLLLQLLA